MNPSEHWYNGLSETEVKLIKSYKSKTGVGSGHYQRKPRNGNRYVRFYPESESQIL